MFKEYVIFGSQNSPANQQQSYGIDLTRVIVYYREPGASRTRLSTLSGGNYDCFMTEAQFDEFKTNLRTANRLKSAYE